jgi:hypothetical protein
MINLRELSTVLAALRYMQGDMEAEGSEWTHGDIATDAGNVTPLSVKDIDALCEKLNCQTKPRVIVEVAGGVAEVTDNPDDVQVDIIDHDNLDDGESDITDEARPTQHGEG